MKAFSFRLVRVLDYRAKQEKWAEDAYREARALLTQAELELSQLLDKQGAAQATHAPSIDVRRSLETYLQKLEDDISAQKTVIDILKSDENMAKEEWLVARRNHEALCKLRDVAEAEWKTEENAEEQKGLDEWSNTRKAA